VLLTCLADSRDWQVSCLKDSDLSTDLGKAYEVLGVKPGVSPRELKVAHRDLAKVWHPDRFQHDLRLQQKAQEKLKEINEAYEQLISGKMPRPTATPPPPQYRREPARRPSTTRQSRGYGFALLTFMAVFALTISIVLQGRAPVPNKEVPADNSEQIASASPDPSANKGRPRSNSPDQTEPFITSVTPSVEPVAIVTVVIDPYTGMLATPDCPVQTSMTYPKGGQPHGYCNARHPRRTSVIAKEPEPAKNSAIKSVAKRLGL
jgi:hypothetical protein